MRAVARAIGRVFAILLITLALDYVLLATVFSDLKRNWTDAATAYTQSYISSPLHHDLGIQVTHWPQWAASRGACFIDGFAPFFRELADTAVAKYFIRGDVHFRDLGNRLLFDEVRSAVGDY